LGVFAGLVAAASLSGAAGQQATPLSYGSAPTAGARTAKAVVMEFSDFHCPFCRRHATETLPRLKRDYVDTGKLLYVFRHFPIDSHPGAAPAAVAGACAGRQGKFWELHTRFFNAFPVPERDLDMHTKAIGVEPQRFRSCVETQGKNDVAIDIGEGNRLGLTGTPAFVFGLNQSNGTFVPLAGTAGAIPYDTFKDAIDKSLAIK
jgi:protein-disulfide isomerase